LNENPEGDLDGVSALDEPTRRSLYRYIVESRGEVSRDQAAAAVGISRDKAAFHLDRLVEKGVLETTFRRLGDRSGPGAGRPSKLYRRSSTTIEASLPPRRYRLAGEVLATAFSRLGPEVADQADAAITAAAREHGRRLASARPHGGEMDSATLLLRTLGFEPVARPNGDIALGNCPFHALAQEFPERICAMNQAFLEGVVEGGMQELRVERCSQPGQCCVCLTPI
jgi:predicted ArsR family transcriptional regulator